MKVFLGSRQRWGRNQYVDDRRNRRGRRYIPIIMTVDTVQYLHEILITYLLMSSEIEKLYIGRMSNVR